MVWSDRLVALVTIVCVFVMTSCSSTLLVPQSVYTDEAQPLDGSYILKTTSGDKYRTRGLVRADSAFVVSSVLRGSYWRSIDPVIVPFAEVASLEKREGHDGRTLLLVVLVAGAVIAVAWAANPPGGGIKIGGGNPLE